MSPIRHQGAERERFSQKTPNFRAIEIGLVRSNPWSNFDEKNIQTRISIWPTCVSIFRTVDLQGAECRTKNHQNLSILTRILYQHKNADVDGDIRRGR